MRAKLPHVKETPHNGGARALESGRARAGKRAAFVVEPSSARRCRRPDRVYHWRIISRA